jgi:ribosome-binding protein aMBF1 (putative translation factor)
MWYRPQGSEKAEKSLVVVFQVHRQWRRRTPGKNKFLCLNEEVGSMRLRGLRQIRQKSGISIGQLEVLSGMRRERIMRIEQGHDDVEPTLARRLAMVLGVSQQELVAGIAISTAGMVTK